MRTLSLHPASLMTGLVLGIIPMLAMSQYQIPRAGGWGPARADVVNLYERYPQPITLAGGASAVIYTVPADKWLTITSVQPFLNNPYDCKWAEDLNGVVTVKAQALQPVSVQSQPPLECGSAGWTFHPGSSVIIRADFDPQYSINFAGFQLTGYLSRD
jgi:hypothetical protein